MLQSTNQKIHGMERLELEDYTCHESWRDHYSMQYLDVPGMYLEILQYAWNIQSIHTTSCASKTPNRPSNRCSRAEIPRPFADSKSESDGSGLFCAREKRARRVLPMGKLEISCRDLICFSPIEVNIYQTVPSMSCCQGKITAHPSMS